MLAQTPDGGLVIIARHRIVEVLNEALSVASQVIVIHGERGAEGGQWAIRRDGGAAFSADACLVFVWIPTNEQGKLGWNGREDLRLVWCWRGGSRQAGR